MAFDAGAIEATLTLNRNPFTAGIAAARAQISEFKKRNSPIEIDIKINLQQRQLLEAEALLKRFKNQVAKATAKVNVDRLQFDALRRDLRAFDRQVYSARIDVDTGRATANVVAFRTLLSTLNDQTVNLNANTRGFGRAAGQGFGEGRSHFERLATLFISLLPVIASAFTATVGAVGALTSGLLIAGLGAGALAIVAVPAIKSVWKAANEGQEAVNKLPPALQSAGNAALGMQNAVKKLTADTQLMVGVGLANWFKAGATAVGTLTPLVSSAAVAFGNAGAMADKFFNSPWWQQFIDFLSRAIGPAVDMLFRSIFALIQIVGNLTQAFWDLGGSEILGMITKGLEDFAKWTDKIGQNQTFIAFMEAAKRSLPAVGKLLGDLLEFVIKVAIGLEPLGTIIVNILDGIFAALNQIPPPLLGAIALGIGAIWAAMALGAGGPVALAVGVLAALAGYLADLYTKNEAFRTTINGLVDDLRARFQPIWDTIVENFNTKILPAWENLRSAVEDKLMPAIRRFGDIFMEEVWPKIAPFVDEITGTLIPSVLNFLATLVKIIAWLVDVFGPTVASEMGDTITVFTGAFDIIAGALDIFTGIFTADWTTFHQGLQEVNQGFWTIIAGMFGTNLEGLRSTVQRWDADIDAMWRSFWNSIVGFFQGFWQTIKDMWNGSLELLRGNTDQAATLIGRAWSRVANLFREPINWVIRTVIGPPGGLAGAWNTVMGWIGAPSLNVSSPPQIPAFGDAFASGGRVRGPGTSTSDEVPALLSNGEFVVRTDVARQIYPFLSALNAGQAEALRAANSNSSVDRMMMRFAGGGVANAQSYAERMVGKPYIWGGAGPGGADCSGLWSIITNAARGAGNPYFRIGTTASFPWGGFTPGLTSALAIGNSRSRGHMAGTLAGTNYEARQTGTPILRSPAAKGADNGYFDAHYSLPQVGGAFVGGGPGGGAPAPVSWWSIIADKVTALFRGLFGGDIPGAGGIIGDAMNNIPRLLVDKVLAAIKTKLEALMTFAGNAIATTAQGAAANPLSGMGTADRGAIIPPGASTLFNATGRPEPLTNLDVYERMKPSGLSVEDVLALIEASRRGDGGSGGGGGDTYNVMLPEKASVRELADTLDFKRRVVNKGRYSR